MGGSVLAMPPTLKGGLGQTDDTKFGSPAAFQFASFSVPRGSAPAALVQADMLEN